ncbi:HNH endonuclease [Nocardioides dongxiaopingii]|uniref:HNH endonuclease signature motif containing protein n=1 Tax=Nocardioides sp. S-1144 TaxID=2582905 RepID=UPI001163F8AD|nr:HNH endonuclease signature motif containing protein [Nocardioides sp. S-1144]QDH11158.1 HNH endonuclease [Nocardioides sp. S-1144]
MPAATARTADPALAAVRTHQAAARRAEIATLVAVLDWATEHTTDADPAAMTFGERALTLGGPGCPAIEEFAAYDLAAALGSSTESGLKYLARALELHHRLPRLWAAVLAGRLPVWKAAKIADATMRLPLDGATHVDARLAQAVSTITYAQLDRLVDEAIARHAPDQATAGRDQRHVRVDLDHATIDGHVRLDALLTVPDALDLEHALQTSAQALADAGCDQFLDVRRSIALGDLARGDQPLDLAGRTLVVHLHQDSPDVGRCETTRTPVTVETIETWCATAAKVVIKPVIDLEQHVHVEAYEAPDRLREHVELRDLTCVFPHCRRPATRCDLDHVVPYSAGGTTSSDNLAPLCRRHHRAKTHSHWTYRMTDPGTYHWTAPSGLTYRRDHHGTTPLDPPPAEPAEP